MSSVALEQLPDELEQTGLSVQSRSPAPAVLVSAPANLAGTARTARVRSWKALVWLVPAVLAIAAAYYQPWKPLPNESAAESHADEAGRAVTIDRPAPATTANVVLPATIRPWQTTALFARVSGYVKAWHQDLGATVEAGDLLAELETPELDQEVAAGEALYREAAAAVVQAQAERTEAEADLRVAEAQFARAQSEAKLARLQLARREKLVATQTVSRDEYDAALSLLEVRTTEVAGTESDIARRRTNLQTRAAIIEARQATANSRRASVDRLKELQTFKRIVAPFSGVVTRRTAEKGMLVTAGRESLFVIEDMSRVRIQTNVPQTYAMQIRPGVAANISLPESTAQAVSGAVTRITESVDATNRTMLAEIELENAAHRFQPGSYGQVTLALPQDHTAWTIPTNTLSMRVDGPHVAVMNAQNQVELRRVSLGRDLGARVVVVEGIRGDERLIVNPSDDLANGFQVQVGPQKDTARLAQR